MRILAAVLAAVVATSALAQDLSSVWRGKTVTILAGMPPGGGYDLTARLIAQFLGNHIPGKPNVIVQNVPGAGSMKLANAIYNNTIPFIFYRMDCVDMYLYRRIFSGYINEGLVYYR